MFTGCGTLAADDIVRWATQPMPRGANNLYSQNIGREFARICVMLALYCAGGACVGLAATIGRSALLGTLVVDEDAILSGSCYGILWGALAIAPMWHRPMLAGWVAVIGPLLIVAALAGFLVGPDAGTLLGVLLAPAVALFVRKRLPIVFPRHPPGQCPVCGYQLSHLRSVRCPECGTHVLSSPPTDTS
ncbi:MAG: transposase [Acidimicrobiia bacterium]|nr:transposase [Acidimicrobiia bacterium]